jgi:hypothetical protein
MPKRILRGNHVATLQGESAATVHGASPVNDNWA